MCFLYVLIPDQRVHSNVRLESAGANEALNEPEFSEYRATIEQQRQQVATGAAGARAGRGQRYVSEEEAMLQYAIHMSLMEQRAGSQQKQGAPAPEGQQGDVTQPQVVPGELSPVDAALLVPDEADENALLQQAIAASLALQQGAGGAASGAVTVEATEAAPATEHEQSHAFANAVPAAGAPLQMADRRTARQSGRHADEEQLKMALQLSMACNFIQLWQVTCFTTPFFY